MENRQRMIRKLLWRITAVLAILAVVSICFVSGTFARYVSNRNGSTVTEVAKWDIDFTHQNKEVTNNFTVTVGKLSPDIEDKFNEDTNKRVQKITPTQPALQITNSGDVDATLTITGAVNTDVYDTNLIYYGTYSETAGGSNAYKKYSGSAEEGELVWGEKSFAVDGTPSAAQAEAVITMEFALTKSTTAVGIEEDEWKSISDFSSKAITPVTVQLPAKPEDAQQGTTYYFYARAVWTSQDKGSTEDAANALDTWFGEHIAAVGAAFTFSVVQASELPGTTTP